MTSPTWTQHGIATIIREQFHADSRAWAFFEEVRLTTGYTSSGSEQRLDAWAISLWSSKGSLGKFTYEIKVSRADWLKELRSPNKRRIGLMLSSRFYFAAPVGVIKPNEVPPECGLIELHADKATKTIVAPHRDCLPPPWCFLASIARCLQREVNQP